MTRQRAGVGDEPALENDHLFSTRNPAALEEIAIEFLEVHGIAYRRELSKHEVNPRQLIDTQYIF